jgi:Fe-Mn family superoxide dismutase
MIKAQPLPYDKNALEPTLSIETFDYHFDKHHLGYANKLSVLIEGTKYFNFSLTDIVLESHKSNDTAIYNNAAQVWNHNFYWKSIGKPQKCPTKLIELLNRDFGSYDNFIEKFIQAGVTLFGSGWIWLVQDKESKKLSILKTKDADNPLILDKTPILTIDVWEHAYYIDYKNDRLKYLDQIIKNNLNWSFAANNIIQ